MPFLAAAAAAASQSSEATDAAPAAAGRGLATASKKISSKDKAQVSACPCPGHSSMKQCQSYHQTHQSQTVLNPLSSCPFCEYGRILVLPLHVVFCPPLTSRLCSSRRQKQSTRSGATSSLPSRPSLQRSRRPLLRRLQLGAPLPMHWPTPHPWLLLPRSVPPLRFIPCATSACDHTDNRNQGLVRFHTCRSSGCNHI